MRRNGNMDLPERRGIETHSRRRVKVAKALGAAAVAPLVLLGADTAITMALEPNVAPGVTMVSTQQQCEKAQTVYFTMSSMGLPIAQYTAGNVREIVEQHGGCVMATSYGTSYNDSTQALLTDEMLQAVRSVTPAGSEAKKVIVHTQSFGIFAGRAALMSDEFKAAEQAGELHEAALIAESAPSGPESVKDPLGRAMIELSQRGFRLGKGALWLFGVASAAERGDDMLAGKTWNDLQTNTMATSTRLIGEQLDRIGGGLGNGATKVPIFYLGSASDRAVAVDIAQRELQEKEGAPIESYAIRALPGSYNHAGSWLLTEYEAAGYKAGINKVLDEVSPAPSQHVGTGTLTQRPA